MNFTLEKFEGPLDLLLRLIKRAEIDIYDIPIAQITAEYLDFIADLPPDMEHLSEFLVMAATLLEIKSRMLLPRPKPESDEPEEDPREALTKQLIAYQQAQELAAQLAQRAPAGEGITRHGDREAFEILDARVECELVPVSVLAQLFAEVMRRASDKIDTVRAGYGEMPREKFTVHEKVAVLRGHLYEKGRLLLSAVFSDCKSRHEMIVTFLAVLEMLRCGIAAAVQAHAFADVEITPVNFSVG